jgi:hypothetical protein
VLHRRTHRARHRLDLGCGAGQAMASFPLSFTPFGIEILSEAAAIADRVFRSSGGYAINAPCIVGLGGASVLPRAPPRAIPPAGHRGVL